MLQNVENVVVSGHPRSLKIAPFDSAYEFLLAFLCPYLASFVRCSEILIENHQLEPTPSLFDATVGGDVVGILPRFLASEN